MPNVPHRAGAPTGRDLRPVRPACRDRPRPGRLGRTVRTAAGGHGRAHRQPHRAGRAQRDLCAPGVPTATHLRQHHTPMVDPRLARPGCLRALHEKLGKGTVHSSPVSDCTVEVHGPQARPSSLPGRTTAGLRSAAPSGSTATSRPWWPTRGVERTSQDGRLRGLAEKLTSHQTTPHWPSLQLCARLEDSRCSW